MLLYGGWGSRVSPVWARNPSMRAGPDHPHTLASRDNLAAAYQEAGRAR